MDWGQAEGQDDRPLLPTVHSNYSAISPSLLLPLFPPQLYELPIIATDGGGRSGFATLKVHVGDENDNAPLFLHREYKAVIYSNATAEMQFMRLQATDADENQNAAIRYSIYDSQNAGVLDLFRIDERSGTMALRKSPKKLGELKISKRR